MSERLHADRDSDGTWHITARHLNVEVDIEPNGKLHIDAEPRHAQKLDVELDTPVNE